ncbi:MAG TPA: nucleoside kinase [Candidatus Saccharimonadia bacterium]|jgi:thymidylate kinase|nr:nucleoside kinase [Candidatus Saccharimonadia bacterium]
MGLRNYFIDGGSGTGKTTVCDELQRRGYQAIHGDRELRAKPGTEKIKNGQMPGHDLPPLWDVARVKALIENHDEPVTFFCGGCSNSSKFVGLLDGVFVLEVGDIDVVMQRIDKRVLVDPTDWGGRPEEREIIRRLHQTKEAIAPGWAIDATAPLEQVVDEILRHVHQRAT